LFAVKDIFLSGITMEIKDDRGTRFWQDKWYSVIPLGSLFRPVYSQAEDPARPVSAHWSKNGWNI